MLFWENNIVKKQKPDRPPFLQKRHKYDLNFASDRILIQVGLNLLSTPTQ